jgi:poly(3-hydroxybutyrate) depolymerase
MKYFPHTWFLFVISILTFPNHQQANAQLSKTHKGYQSGYHQGMRYGLFKPDNYSSDQQYPLIVYLHGSTDTVSRDLMWYRESIQKKNPCFVLSPKTEEGNQGWGNTWEKNHSPAMKKTLSLIDSLVKKYNLDKTRLYIYGISMGGFGVFSALAKEPGKFAGAYAVCGGSDVNAASSVTTPLWIFHGAEDDVVPVRLSRNMYQEMLKNGNKRVRYTEYAGVKHNSWENVNNEESLTMWLLFQQNGKVSNAPGQVQNLTLNKLYNSTMKLQWSESKDIKERDNEIWYYKIFRDGELIGEVDGKVTEFNDYKYGSSISPSYHVVAVNYAFKESKPSDVVKID